MTCNEQMALAFFAGALAMSLMALWPIVMPWWMPGSVWPRPPKRLR